MAMTGLRIVGSDGVIETTHCGEVVRLISKTREEYDLPLAPAVPFFKSFLSELQGVGKCRRNDGRFFAKSQKFVWLLVRHQKPDKSIQL